MKFNLLTTLVLGLKHLSFGDIREKEIDSVDFDEYENNLISPSADTSTEIPFQFFSQKVDNFNSSDSRTYLQKYYVDDRNYQPGGPVFLSVTGEWALPRVVKTDKLDRTLEVALSRRYNGMVIGLEHRYYGNGTSIPVNGSLRDPANLQYLTVDQALADTANFIQNLPFQNSSASLNLSSSTKWIVVGGSYAGNLAAWMKLSYPEKVFGAHASSGPFLAKLDFWEYADAVRLGLSQSGGSETCVNGWIRAVSVFDKFVNENNETFVKEYFGAPPEYALKDLASMTTVFSTVVQYGDKYADGKMEIVADNNTIANSGHNVTYVEAACNGTYIPSLVDPQASDQQVLSGLATFMKLYFQDLERERDEDSNGDQPPLWTWQYCNDFGYLQTADLDPSHGTMFSKLVDIEYFEANCESLFGKEFRSPNIARVNNKYKGLDIINVDNVVFVNGKVDPWHRLSVSEKSGNSSSVVINIEGGHHCSDLSIPTDTSPQTSKDAYQKILEAWDKILA